MTEETKTMATATAGSTAAPLSNTPAVSTTDKAGKAAKHSPPPTSDIYKQVLAAPRDSFVTETVEQIRAAKAEIVRTNIDSSERLASLGEPAGSFALRYVLMQLANRRNKHARLRQLPIPSC
jgi:hypothetical protein